MKIKNYFSVLAFLMASLTGYAQSYTDINTGLTFSLNATGATITGSSAGQNLAGALVIPNAVWTDASHTTGGNVVAITPAAFQSNSKITSLDMSQATHLTSIGQSAFIYCSGITTLALPPNLTSMDVNVFMYCSGITGELKLPESLTSINDNAFWGCSGLTALTLPANLASIGSNAFQACSGITGDLIIPHKVSTIGNMSFLGDAKLRSITFQSPTLNISWTQAFVQCNGLEYIDMSACTLGTHQGDLIRSGGGPFGGVQTNTVIYLPNGTPDNMMPPAAANANSPTTSENVNYVRLDQIGAAQCALFNVADGKDYFLPHSFQANNASISGRNFQPAPQANTLYLPLDTKIVSGATAYTLEHYNQHSPEPNDNTFVFTPLPADATLKANTPYIVVGAGSLTTVSPVTVPASPIGIGHDGVPNPVVGSLGNTVSDNNGNSWRFCGTTEATGSMAAYLGGVWDYKSTWGSLTTYNLGANNTWGWATAGIGTQRAFIAQTAGTPGISMSKISLAKQTIIDGMEAGEPANYVETRIYTVNGQYVGRDLNALSKGLYIVNGKKVMK